MEDVPLRCEVGHLFHGGRFSQLHHGGCSAGCHPFDQGIRGLAAIAFPWELVRFRCAGQGIALRVAQNENELCLQLVDAELQATHHASLSMGAGVAGIPQHEQVPRQGIEDGLQRHPGVGAADDGGVRGLAGIHILPHFRADPVCHSSAAHEAPIALFQELYRDLGRGGHGILGTGRGLLSPCDGFILPEGQQFALTTAMANEVHAMSLSLVNTTLNLQLATADFLLQHIAP
mmetsp:Transcript_121894/g.289845  ORF Transcript_121894/g.289845 Transcript_121894/m.289845 type:complete len:232 (-) Transcript_121894:1606-2301(-)